MWQIKYSYNLYLVLSIKEWNISILRYFNPVGAYSSGEIGEDPQGIPNNLMPYVAQVAAGKLPYLQIYGTNFDTPDGTGIRDYIHIVDLARAHVAALARMQKLIKYNEKPRVEVYNIGTGKGTSVREMISNFEKVTGKKVFLCIFKIFLVKYKRWATSSWRFSLLLL